MHFVMGKVQDDGFAGNYNSVEGLLHFHQKIKKNHSLCVRMLL